MLFTLSVPTRDPEVPATQAMEGLPASWVEENCLTQTCLAQEHRLKSSDFAIGLAASVTLLNEIRDIRNWCCHHHLSLHFALESWPVGVVKQEGKKSQLYMGLNWRP